MARTSRFLPSRISLAGRRTKGGLRWGLLVLALGALVLGACSLDYGQGQGDTGEELPDAVFRNFEHTVVDRGARIFTLKAAKAESYNAAKKTVLESVAFAEYDRVSHEAVTTGRAERAVLFTDSEDAEFSGLISIDSTREDILLEAEYLAWDASEKRLEGRLDRTVTVKRGDGSWVRGAGFNADARRRSFSFREATEGAFVTSDGASEDASAPTTTTTVEEPAPAATPVAQPAAQPAATPLASPASAAGSGGTRGRR